MPVRRNYSDIVKDGKARLQNYTTLNNFNSTGTIKGLLDIIGLEGEKLYDSLEYLFRSNDPTRATGGDLDKWGFLNGEGRESAITATDATTTNFYFYIDPRINLTPKALINNYFNSEEIIVLENAGYVTTVNGQVSTLIIPAGHIVNSYNGNIAYRTTQDAVFSATQSEAYVGIIATGAGNDFNVETNVLIQHSLNNILELRKLARFIKCTNRFPIQNGRYSLTDSELRYKISTSKAAIITNELAVRRAALSVPGVRDILFEKGKYGNGTVNIIVDGVSPLLSEGLTNAVKQKIQSQVSYGDLIFVNAPEYKGVELNFNLRIVPGSTDSLSIKEQARNTIIQYINNLSIGGEIIWNQLVSTVLDIPNIEDLTVNYFKIGDYDPINKINRKQIVLRTINQKVKYNQKLYCDSGLITCCID